MSHRTLPGLVIFFLLGTLGADGATAQGKVGYRGHGRYAGAKPAPVAPAPSPGMSAHSTPGAGSYYGAPPTDYQVDPYAGRYPVTPPYPHTTLVDPYASLYESAPAHPRRHRHHGKPHVIPYYVPVYLPTQPTVYERPYEEEVYFAPEPEEQPAPAPVVVVVQAPGGSIPAVGEVLGAGRTVAPAAEPSTSPSRPEPPKAPVGPGRIELSVQPAEAKIYLDDRYLGTAAEVAAKGGALRVDSGVHVLQVTHPAHKPERMVFGVAAGGGVKVEVDLSGQRLIRRSHFEPLGKTVPLVEFDG